MAAGWTQAELARRAGLSAKYISEIERGTRDVPVSTLEAIVADGLGLAIDVRFLAGTGPRTEREPVPRAVDEVARSLAELPDDRRAEVLRLIRALVRLAT